MPDAINRVYEFGEFRLDTTERLLLRNGEILPLTPKVFDTLLKLVKNHGRLIEKDEFMEGLWPDTHVGEDTLAHNISVIRKVLGDTGNGQKYIVTIPKRGYRFVAAVHETNGANKEVGEKASARAQVTTELRSEERELLVETAEADLSVPVRGAPPRDVVLPRTKAALSFRFGKISLIALAVVVGLLAGLVTFALLSPPGVPRVVGVTQITRSGRVDPWGKMVSDGSRIYFLERAGDH